MITFEVNLIRDRVMPASRRKALYCSITVYSLFCIAAIVLLTYAATRNVVEAAVTQRQLAELTDEYTEGRGESLPPAAHAKALSEDLTAAANTLEAADGILRQRVDLARASLAIAGGLPPEIRLMNLKLDGRKRTVTFDVVVTKDPEASGLSTAALVQHWEANPEVTSRLGEIRAATTRTQRMQGETVWIWQFVAKILLEG